MLKNKKGLRIEMQPRIQYQSRLLFAMTMPEANNIDNEVFSEA